MAVELTTPRTVQSRETVAAREAIAALQFQTFARSALADGSVCTYQMTSSPHVFDSTFVGTRTPPMLSFGRQLLATASVSAPALATVGRPANSMVPELIVHSIELTQIASAGVPDQWVGSVQLAFDPSGLIRALPPASILMRFTTTGPANAKTVLFCNGVAGTPTANGIGTNVVSFSNPGPSAWQVPDSVQQIFVRVVGGGGGGAAAGTTWSGGGGGSGGYAEGIFWVTSGQTLQIIVGSGGSGGGDLACDSNVGQDGGTSSLQIGSSQIYAIGGGGGSGSPNNTDGGASGQGFGGQVNIFGAYGGEGNCYTSGVQGGAGGASAMGGGGRTSCWGFPQVDLAAMTGVAPGSGGGGSWGYPCGLAGPGANGLVAIVF